MEWYIYALVKALFAMARTRRQALVLGLIIFLVNTGLLFFAAIYEDTLYMEGENQGLLELPGVIGILVGDLLTMSIVQWMVNHAEKMTKYFPTDKSRLSRRYLKIAKTKMLSYIRFENRGARIYLLMCLFATLFWANNARQTLDPYRFYGCDVFGSMSNPIGYFLEKIVFFISWVVLLPYMAYVSLVITFTFFKLISTTRKHNMLKFNIFHKDGCGGFSYLGDANIIFLVGMLVVYGELILVLFQHKHFNPGLISGFVIATAMLLTGTSVMLYPLRGFLRGKKILFLTVYSERLRRDFNQETFSRFTHVKSRVSFSPYSGKERLFISLVRLSPLVFSSLKAYLHIL